MNNYNIYPIILSWKTNKQGLAPIAISFDFNNKKIAQKTTGKKIPPQMWDAGQKRVKSSYQDAVFINEVIELQLRNHRSFFLRREAMQLPINKEIILQYASLEKGLQSFIDYAEWVIENKRLKDGNPYSEDTKRRYRDEVKRLAEYQAEIEFNKITVEWLLSYKSYLQDPHGIKRKALHPNSIWKTFSFMQMVYKEAIKNGIILPDNNPFPKFGVGTYEQDDEKIKWLELDQVQKIEDTLNEKRYIMEDITYRIGWRYLAMCVTGMRISDAMLLDDMMFNDAGDLVFKPHKTRRYNNKAQVPIGNERQRRYMDKTLSLALPSSDGKKYRTTFNNHLKLIAAHAGLSVHLTSHVGRHTMGSFLVDANIEDAAAKAILGVKSDRTLKVYRHLKQSKLHSEASKLNNIM